MIEMKLADAKKIEETCARLHAEYTPGLLMYVVTEREEELGCCAFEKNRKNGRLVFSAMNGENLAMIEDGLLRATLSYLFEKGVEEATCGGGVEPKLLKRLGFREAGGVYTLSLGDSFLTRACPSAK